MTHLIPETMCAMVTMGHGGLDQMVFHDDWPTPVAGPDSVLVRVGACGLNNTDVNTRSGWYSKTVSGATTGNAYDEVGEEDPTWGGRPITFPRIQGADVCGEIVAVGGDIDPARIGERVITDNWIRDPDDLLNKDKAGYYGSECDGGFAEYVIASAPFAAVDTASRASIHPRSSWKASHSSPTTCLSPSRKRRGETLSSLSLVLSSFLSLFSPFSKAERTTPRRRRASASWTWATRTSSASSGIGSRGTPAPATSRTTAAKPTTSGSSASAAGFRPRTSRATSRSDDEMDGCSFGAAS